jgi:hypothetical protein
VGGEGAHTTDDFGIFSLKLRKTLWLDGEEENMFAPSGIFISIYQSRTNLDLKVLLNSK